MNPLLLDIPESIDGSRIRLKSFDAPDAEVIHEAVIESQQELGKQFAWGKTIQPLDDRRAGLRRGLAELILRREIG